jgi:LysE type translocator
VLPSLDVLAAFTAASLVLIFTESPSAANIVCANRPVAAPSIAASPRARPPRKVSPRNSVISGPGAVLAASAAAFVAIKVAGVAYLLWLAIAALRHGTALTLDTEATNGRPLHRAYLMGLGVNLLNPKIVMFFLPFCRNSSPSPTRRRARS